VILKWITPRFGKALSLNLLLCLGELKSGCGRSLARTGLGNYGIALSLSPVSFRVFFGWTGGRFAEFVLEISVCCDIAHREMTFPNNTPETRAEHASCSCQERA
jgi:hypothetical protein